MSFGVVFGVPVVVSLVVFFIVGDVSLCVTCLGIVGRRVSGVFCRCVPEGWWHAVRPVSACVRVSMRVACMRVCRACVCVCVCVVCACVGGRAGMTGVRQGRGMVAHAPHVKFGFIGRCKFGFIGRHDFWGNQWMWFDLVGDMTGDMTHDMTKSVSVKVVSSYFFGQRE